jgi:hypothetical protein
MTETCVDVDVVDVVLVCDRNLSVEISIKKTVVDIFGHLFRVVNDTCKTGDFQR